MVKQKKCPLISVILSTYNWRDKWLKRAIDSIYIQTFKDFELILINDCSTNKIENVIKEYIKKYSNIIYVKKENGGVSSARNNGLQKATGKYVNFLDSDDKLTVNTLTAVYGFFEKNYE